MKKEFSFNLIGKFSNAFSTLVMFPIVGYYFGEVYLGLYGVFAFITSVVLVLEGGLSASLISKLSKHRNDNYSEVASRILLEYFVFFFLLALASFVIVFVLGDIIIKFSTNLAEYPNAREVFFFYAVLCSCAFLVLYFQSVSFGLGLFKKYNVFLFLFSISKVLVPVFFITYLSFFNYENFLIIIIVCNFIFLITCFFMVFSRKRFLELNCNLLKLIEVREGLKLGVPIFFVSITSIFYTQYDKLLALKYFNLETFGVYSTAASLAAMPLILSGVLYSVLLPKFVNLKEESFIDFRNYIYKMSFNFLSFSIAIYIFALLSIFFVVSFFSPQFLLIDGSFFYFYLFFSVLLLGSIIQALSVVPFCFQIAFGDISTTLKFNVSLLPIFAILFPVLVHSISPVVLPFFWLSYNFIFIFIIYRFAVNPILLKYEAI